MYLKNNISQTGSRFRSSRLCRAPIRSGFRRGFKALFLTIRNLVSGRPATTQTSPVYA